MMLNGNGSVLPALDPSGIRPLCGLDGFMPQQLADFLRGFPAERISTKSLA
jgi:hypothetical protein